MESNKINLMWSISLLVIGIVTILLTGANLMGIDLSNTAIRILGVSDIIAIPILAFSTIKKSIHKK